MISFSSLNISTELKRALSEIGLSTLTPIQGESIPLLLQGRDLVGQSKTGSGKTIAYALPILNKISVQNREIQALVLCPTRELCTQVTREFRKLGRHFPGLSVVPLIGGQPLNTQAASLHHGAHIAVATPGRLLDHLQRGTLRLDAVSTVVLDEADRMLDMGFAEDIEKILYDCPRERQTIFFSATFPESIEAMSATFQNNPAQVKVEAVSVATIEEIAMEVAEEDKLLALLACLREFQPESAIVFCNLKVTVADLAEALVEAGVSAAGLQGDLEQAERDRVMAKFRNGSTRVLVATDVAARGIDVAGLDLVVNFDLPRPEIYVHRIGRTGRAGKSGRAISLAQPSEQKKIRWIEEELHREILRRPVPSLSAESLPAPGAAMTTLFISAGRKEKMRPGDILGALTGEAAGLDGKAVGKIEIHDHFSYVAIQTDQAEKALNCLRNGKIKGRRLRIEFVR